MGDFDGSVFFEVFSQSLSTVIMGVATNFRVRYIDIYFSKIPNCHDCNVIRLIFFVR